MADKKKKKEKKYADKLNSAKNSRLSYTLYIWLFVLFAKIRYHLRIDKKDLKGKKGPFLVLGNHTSWLDFLYFAGCVYPRPLNVVVASNIFYRSFLRKVMEGYGVIPKKQFASDFTCIKLIKKFLDNGSSVLLFPEGRITVDGTTGYIAPSIGKLVKWLGYPVVRGITVGSYVTRPKWGNKRPGFVKLTVEEILSKENIEKMTAGEIADLVTEKLEYNDNKSFVERGSRLIGCNMAEGMEKLLYKCPNCGAEFKNISHRKQLVCQHCNNTVIYGHDAMLHPKTDKDICFTYINDWYDYQRKCVKEEVAKENFEVTEKVVLQLNSEKLKSFVNVGCGELTVNREGIAYVGTMNKEQTSMIFSLKNHPTVAYKIGQNIEIAEDENIYKFVFEHGLLSTKTVLIIEELYKLYCTD